MAKVLDQVERLSPALQLALVSFEEVAEQIQAHPAKLDPAARQLFRRVPRPSHERPSW
jgi:hypothetical protein